MEEPIIFFTVTNLHKNFDAVPFLRGKVWSSVIFLLNLQAENKKIKPA